MAQQQKIRRFVMTGAVFAITATGAWYGAGLKTQQEFKKVRQSCEIALSSFHGRTFPNTW
jgi:hypothetical protein